MVVLLDVVVVVVVVVGVGIIVYTLLHNQSPTTHSVSFTSCSREVYNDPSMRDMLPPTDSRSTELSRHVDSAQLSNKLPVAPAATQRAQTGKLRSYNLQVGNGSDVMLR